MIKTIVPFTNDKIEPCVELYISVFNQPPWNEAWTYEDAKERLIDLVQTPKFIGFLLYDSSDLVGFIAGNNKQSYTGLTFYLAELCINSQVQGKGYGSQLLLYLEDELKKRDVKSLYLLTAKGGLAETFYRKNNYRIKESRLVINKELSN